MVSESHHLSERRGFFREFGRWAKEETIAFAEPFVDDFLERVEPALAALAGPQLLRPPGALEEHLFRETCTRCHGCIEACPHGAIVPADEGTFPEITGEPIIQPRSRACHMCEVLHCQEACPSGALRSVERRQIRMGRARVLASLCSAHHGVVCRTCHLICPLRGEAIEMQRGLPVVHPEICTGCGLCEYACPTHPAAIRVFSER